MRLTDYWDWFGCIDVLVLIASKLRSGLEKGGEEFDLVVKKISTIFRMRSSVLFGHLFNFVLLSNGPGILGVVVGGSNNFVGQTFSDGFHGFESVFSGSVSDEENSLIDSSKG